MTARLETSWADPDAPGPYAMPFAADDQEAQRCRSQAVMGRKAGSPYPP